MTDRVLDPQSEPNFFSEKTELPRDFWERYFALQKMATMAKWQNGSFIITFTDEQTGKIDQLKNIRFSTESEAELN